MYCLDCGKKIDEDQDACPYCGAAVSEMRERLAKAEEMLTYAETVGPSKTSKLPPVKDRTYVDFHGNPLDPSEKVDFKQAKEPSLDHLPRIGSDDPYVTMPIQRVVDDCARVVADRDTVAKAYVQAPVQRRSHTVLKVVVALAVLALVVCVGLWALENTPMLLAA